jgi:hypothetical protein
MVLWLFPVQTLCNSVVNTAPAFVAVSLMMIWYLNAKPAEQSYHRSMAVICSLLPAILLVWPPQLEP